LLYFIFSEEFLGFGSKKEHLLEPISNKKYTFFIIYKQMIRISRYEVYMMRIASVNTSKGSMHNSLRLRLRTTCCLLSPHRA